MIFKKKVTTTSTTTTAQTRLTITTAPAPALALALALVPAHVLAPATTTCFSVERLFQCREIVSVLRDCFSAVRKDGFST